LDELQKLRAQPYAVRLALCLSLFYTAKTSNSSLPIEPDIIDFASKICEVSEDEVWGIVVQNHEREFMDKVSIPSELIKVMSAATLMLFPMEVNDEN
jgi:hypothetical protein